MGYTVGDGDSYLRLAGTSMAAPHVTGAIGLILSQNPSLNTEEAKQVLRMSEYDILDTGWDEESGYGRLDLFSAVNASTFCEATITNPEPYAIKGTGNAVEVDGYVGGADFGSYELELYFGDALSTDLVSSTSGSSSVSGPMISAFVGFEDGVYSLKLSVYDTSGNLCAVDKRSFISTSYSNVFTMEGDYSYGESLSTGDIDNDRQDDLLIGSANSYEPDPTKTDFGHVYLIYSGLAPSDSSFDGTDSSVSSVSWVGSTVDDFIGGSVQLADIDGDGNDDVILAAAGASDNGDYSGKVCIFNGSSSSSWTRDMSIDSADYCFYGENAEDFLGSRMEVIGDANLDGLPDIAVAACGNDEAGSNVGKVYLLYSSQLSSWRTGSINNSAGTMLTSTDSYGNTCTVDLTDTVFPVYFDDKAFSFAGGQDLNADGIDDIVIGVPSDGLYIFSASSGGIPNGSLADASTHIITPDNSGYFGENIALLGDINGDGLSDLAVSYKDNVTLGSKQKVYLIYGSTILNGEGSVDTFSPVELMDTYFSLYSPDINALGDLNGDGLNDFAVSIPMATYYQEPTPWVGPGLVLIYYGNGDLHNSSFLSQAKSALYESSATGLATDFVLWDYDADGDAEFFASGETYYLYVFDDETVSFSGKGGLPSCGCYITSDNRYDWTWEEIFLGLILVPFLILRFHRRLRRTGAVGDLIKLTQFH